MQTMHTVTEPSEKPVQDAGVNMNLFKEGGRRPPALPPSMAGGDNANSNTETITMEFVVDPSVYRSANYQPTPKMLAALKKSGTRHKSQKTDEVTTVDKKPTTAERDNGGNALSAIDIMIERLKREEESPTPLNPHPKKWAYKKRPQRGVPKGGTEKPTIDESPEEGLQKHDERFHEGHYEGGECKYREDRGIPQEPTPPPTSSAQQSAASQPSASEVAREDTVAVSPTDESASVVSPTEAPTAVPSPAENSQAAQKTPQNAIAAPIPAVPSAQAQSASSPVESPEKVYEGIPKKKVVEYKRRMEKSRPYLDADQILSELSKIKDKKIQSDAFEWVLKGAVRLPEDLYKVQRAREMATKGKVDPLSYETPEACIADLYDSGMRDSVKPISVEELKQNPLMSNYRNHGYGIETFEVQDDEDGQALMRKVIDTHWGQDASPWCLLQGKDVYWASCFGDECGDEGGDPDILDEDERAENRASAEKWWKRLGEQGRLDFLRQHNEPSAKDITKKLFRDEELQEFAKGKIWDAPYAAEYFAKNKIMPYDERFSGVSDDAWGYWERYSALPKRVAFKDGKLLAFMGTEGYDSVDEALRDFTSAELAGRLPMLYDEYISQVRNAIEEGDEETAEEVREKYGEDEDEWIEHFDEWMEDSNNWWGYEDEEEILRELTPEEWWDRQDSPHKGIPMGLTTLSDSEKKRLRDTLIKRAQTNGNSLSPDELEVGKGFSRDAELMPSGTVEWSGDYIRGRDGHPGYMRLDSRGQLKEDIQADGTRRRFDFDFIKGTYLHDTVSKSPDGTETKTAYFPGGEKKSETITAPGKTAEERNWDVEGRLIYEHASGRRRRWDGATGNLIQDVDALGVVGHEWTPDGVMTYEHLPNGDMTQWDSKGNKVFERKNTPGCLMSASWNPRQIGGGLDRIAKRYNDGTSEEWEWYPGGELKSYRGKDGKLKEWSSTGRQLEFSLGEHTDEKGNKAEWGAKTLRIDPSYMDLNASVTLADGNEALLRNETRPRVGGLGEKGHLYTKDGTISWFTGDRLDVLDVIGNYHGKKFFGAFTHDSLTPIAARCSENFPMDEARHWIGETWKAKERAQKFNEPDPYAKEHSLPQGKNAEMPEWVGFPKNEKNTDSLNAPKAPGAKEAAAIVGDEAPTKSALMMAFDESPEEGLQKHDERFHGGHYDGGECKYRTDRGIPTAEPTSNQKPQEESAEQIDDVDVLEVNAGGAESIEREDTLEKKAPAEAPTKAPVEESVAEQHSAPPTWTAKLREAAERAARALRNFLPGVKVEFADRPRDEEAPVEEGTRLSVADIAKLSYKMNEQDVSLKSFANTFQTVIKGKDRTLEDAERIANDYLAAVKEAPEKFVPQLRPEKMTHMRYLFTSKGELYDPDNLQHVGMENDIPRQVYNLYKDALGEERFEQMQTLLKMGKEITPEGKAELAALEAAANESDTMQRALAENAERVNDERVKKVSELCQYFSGNDDYTATEKALIINGAMRYGISERMTENGLEVRLVSLADNNDAQVPVMGGEQTAKIVEHLRKGESYKNAVVAATKEMREIKAEKRGVPPNFTGWKVYGKDSSHEAAVELNNAVAGTGWCTGGAVSTAQMHRSGGDFHVYFRNGEPLIALRTNNGRLAEAPRGAHPGQFCTGEEEEIAEDYIRAGNGIVAGKAYLDDRADIRKVQSGQLTWQDALRIPKERRYENGEYGGDTKAWPEPMRKAIEKVIADHDEERKAAGWLTLDEAYEQPEKVKVIIGRAVLGWSPMRDMSFPNLEEVQGDLRLHSGRQYEFPKLKRIGGYANFPKGASAPILESIGGNADIHNGSSIPLLTSIGGNISIASDVSVPALKSVGRSVTIYPGSSAPALTSIGGSADIYNDASAPALESIGGDAYLHEGSSAPALKSIGGDAALCEGASAPALTSIGGDAHLYEGSSAPALTSIGGDAHLYEGSSAPALASVGGNAYLYQGVSAPALKSIGGNAELRRGSSAPALTSIGGDAHLYEGSSAPALTSIGGDAHLYEGSSAPALASVGGNADIYKDASAPALKRIGGDATLFEGSSAPALASVGGNADFDKDASAPALTSVGGDATLDKGSSAPALTSIGGKAKLYEGSSAPALASVGGNADIYKDASAPALKRIGGDAILFAGVFVPALTSIGGNATLFTSAPALTSVGGDATLFEGVSVPNLERVGESVTSHGNVHAPKLKMNHDTRELRGEGGAVVGEYDRRTNKVTLYPGATAETVVHELAGHGAYQYAEQLAAKGNTTLLDRLNAIADNAPQSVKDEVTKNYSNASDAVKREELWTHVFAERGAEALRKAQESKRGATWFKRMMGTARDVVRGIGSRVGLNRMDLTAIDNMSASETLDWLATQMAEGKTLGRIRREKAAGDTAEGVRSALMSALDEAPAVAPKGGWEKHNKQFHNGKMPTPEHCKFLQEHGGASTPSASSETPEEVSDVDTVEVGNEEKPSSVVTAEEDAAYMDAVKRGDMETAQKMVREAAAKEGFVHHAYHGTPKAGFTTFDPSRAKRVKGNGIYFTSSQQNAASYSGKGKNAGVYDVYLKMKNPLEVDAEGGDWGDLTKAHLIIDGEKSNLTVAKVFGALNSYTDRLAAYVNNVSNFDSIIIRNVADSGTKGKGSLADDFIMFKPEDIKSAAPVTYDDEGNVIPLSQRFNRANPDIRYSADKEKAQAGWSKRLRTMAQAAARMVERFMPGVKVRLSETPYEGGGDERKSISGVFTGTAADYDKPSLLKVGTGEGSNVFGWGLYGSSERGVANKYANQVSGVIGHPYVYLIDGKEEPNLQKYGEGFEYARRAVIDEGKSPEEALREFRENVAEYPQLQKAIEFLEKHSIDGRRERKGVILEQTFFTNRAPGDDSHLLMWEEPIGLKKLKEITEALPFEKQRIFRSWVRDSLPYGNKPQHAWGGDVYKALANTLDGYRAASEFLRDKLDYDGVKVPVGTFHSLHKQDGDKVGWNYVSFRDDNIRVDHKWVDGDMRYFKGDGGKVVGTYNRRTGEVVLYPGADKNTIAHELGGHATWQYAEQLAKEGNDKLLNKMNQVVDAAPSNIKDEVAENYGKEANAVQREEIWAHVMGHRGSAAIQKALESKRGRSWWGRFWNTAKEAWRGLASKVGLNRTSLDNIGQMSPDEFADYMAKEMVSGKVLGNIKYAKSDNSSSDDKRKQIVGTRGARKLGIGNQSDAQQMESDGASREDIWRKTGWWKGQDGQWRIEIADIPDVFKPLSQKEATRLKALKAAEKKEDAAVKDAIKKYKAARDSGNADEANKYADEAERHEAASLKHSQARYPLEARSKGWTEDILGNLLADHPLLKAYPWLSQTKVNRVSLPEGIGGHTDSSKNVITLSDTNTDAENHSALAHEIQHLIQSVEGFAQGADPDEVGMSDYIKHGGEVESRNVEKRLTMSPEERAATPPWETEDVAESEQIVSRD